ncbi:MAG TPA: hypothetical protein VFX25_09675, partial [Streptosporangiaceae bacterium]|nr:hypothetical protein [Streptosporangiaceae bacterium]
MGADGRRLSRYPAAGPPRYHSSGAAGCRCTRVNDRDAAERTALIRAVTGIGTEFNVRPNVLARLVENG